MEEKIEDFKAIKISIGSPEKILSWSRGEVTKPETINYRTQKPERDGLFCERIFGPTKDWECYCGKYKRIRYKGIVCEKCGVEVTRSLVRRDRMGHITLACPIAHIWYIRGNPTRVGLILDLPLKDLEQVIYFGGYIITEFRKEEKEKAHQAIEEDYAKRKKEILAEYEKKIKGQAKVGQSKVKGSIKVGDRSEKVGGPTEVGDRSEEVKETKKEKGEVSILDGELQKELEALESIKNVATSGIDSLEAKQIISEVKYRNLISKYGQIFKAEMGAEAIFKLLKEIDLDKLSFELTEKIKKTGGQKKRKLQKQLKLVESFRKQGARPEWMILQVLPVIPPDLRPMVQLDGGRFATSDLNDLYRRVINRNNRLKRLLALKAPEVICRNEKRMLQEAVDALIDNEARRGKAVTTRAGRRLKSLSDILRGKQGRFRQNLLGKRVDYSARSVIVVGPELKLSECGLPKKIALELFKPFIIGRLIKEGFTHNVKIASRMIEQGRGEVWDILEKIIQEYHVLLNRAPTLHRLGIQAFRPVLIEGSAIQIHPLVCVAFNADFDGDQMACHLPLSVKAQDEASEIMLSTKNILKPSDGTPVVSPSQDIVLGCYYLTNIKEKRSGEGKFFRDKDEAILAYENGLIHLQAKIKLKLEEKVIETSVGRILFNEILPKKMGFKNQLIKKANLKDLVLECFNNYGLSETIALLDEIKELGFRFATQSGMTIALSDLETPPQKEEILKRADAEVEEIRTQYKRGLITEREREARSIEVWIKARDEIESEIERILKEECDRYGSVYSMVDSGARGSLSQVNQLCGMKGLVVNPLGDIIELPIRSNFREGFSTLEYFISMHGARKGKSDTALRTSDSGYLTRRLVDVAQEVIITSSDCGDKEGTTFFKNESSEPFKDRVFGRITAQPVVNKKGEKILSSGVLIEEKLALKLEEECDRVNLRTPLSCKNNWGICQKCYGTDLARGEMVELGTVIGIMAAQSIGEPGTQLTMRTFHAGGIAGEDITHGLPRVEELFEARAPKGEAIISEIPGEVEIVEKANKKIIRIEGEKIKREYLFPPQATLIVKNKDKVEAGDLLTEGHLNLQNLLRIKGEEAVQKYIISEIQEIYSSQGQTIHDKHLEIIVRRMFSKLRIKESGDSDFIPGEIVDRVTFEKTNSKIKKQKGKPARGERLLLGITKAALLTASFLSAASFQETTRVLVEAAVSGAIDELRGLKENVIIGRLIPAGTGFPKEGD